MTGASVTEAAAVRAAARLPIEPRIRARLIEVRRNEGRRRLRWLGLGVLAGLLVIAAWGVAHSPLLRVHRVELWGAVRTGRAAVLAATGLERHPQMVDLDIAKLRRQVAALPWVSQASVERRWPTTIVIHVKERIPLAQARDRHGQPVVVDATGRVLAVGAEAARVLSGSAPPLPVLQGVPDADGVGSSLAPAAHDVLALAAGLPPAVVVAGRPVAVRTVAALADQGLVVTLTSGLSVDVGSADALGAKLVSLRTLLQQVSLPGSAVVDVRVPDAPVLTRR